MGLTTDVELEFLQATQTAINKYSLPENIRPCAALMIDKPMQSIKSGGSLGRQTAGMIIATNLRSLGQTEEQIRKRLEIWNRNNLPPLPRNEFKGILTQTFKQKETGKEQPEIVYCYNYGCNGKYYDLLQFEDVCIGKEYCYYYQQRYVKKGIKPKVNYIATSWQYVLTSREQLVLFYVIPELEKLKKVWPGYTLFATYRELHKYTGIQQRFFKDILTALKQYGLIEYTPGTQYLWEHNSTEIRRVIPPPKIPKEYINKPKDYKKHIKKDKGQNG